MTSTLSFTIKNFSPDMLDSLWNIDLKSFDRVWSIEKFHNFKKTIRAVVCNDTGRVIAFYAYLKRRARIVLVRLAVTPMFRRRGVAKEMFEDFIRQADTQEHAVIRIPESNTLGCVFLNSVKCSALPIDDWNRKNGSINFQRKIRFD